MAFTGWVSRGKSFVAALAAPWATATRATPASAIKRRVREVSMRIS